MESLDSLKAALLDEATGVSSLKRKPLSNEQYAEAYAIITRGLGELSYDNFIAPEMGKIMTGRFSTQRARVSVLEIGPGPKSVLGRMPLPARRLVTHYTALEPNDLFAGRLEEWLDRQGSGDSSALPSLQAPATILRSRFTADEPAKKSSEDTFDVILFCHSMYGMKPRKTFLLKALKMLAKNGVVVVFHRGDRFNADGLVCHQTAVFPTSKVSVKKNDVELDRFAAFVAGFIPQQANALLPKWRRLCHVMGDTDSEDQNTLSFSCPVVMVTFTANATAVSQLLAKVPTIPRMIKNRHARLERSAAHVAPQNIEDVQFCVRWAIENGLGLTVMSGGHSEQGIRSNVVAVDMSTFNEVHVCEMDDAGPKTLIVVGSGSTAQDIILKTIELGLVVPLGARPSIGAGMWLQGGLGHLTRQYGLSCDAIVGAVVVTVDSGEVICVGNVPRQHRPCHAGRARNEIELLWALKGAGTNFGIVINVVFRTFPLGEFEVRTLNEAIEIPFSAELELRAFESNVTDHSPRSNSEDIYLYHEAGQMQLGYYQFKHLLGDVQTRGRDFEPDRQGIMNGVQLFDADMYMTGDHRSHGGGKTSSFKRCLFLKDIRCKFRASALIDAYCSRPSFLCYLHLLHGGGAANDLAAGDTAFGCRDWNFACVITGVWPRVDDDTNASRIAKDWVYRVAAELLPLSSGVYSADLGPDPRDRMLARMAFGPNLARLSRMKKCWDPFNVLAYACPLLEQGLAQKLIIMVTGSSGAGKDHCAVTWARSFTRRQITARVVSISDVTKEEYAKEKGAKLQDLLYDRAYKEKHREGLTTFFREQVRKRPLLPEKHFKSVVAGAFDVDVLFITGMRDAAPVATFAHLAPGKKVVEVRVVASRNERKSRTRKERVELNDMESDEDSDEDSKSIWHDTATRDDCPNLIFDNTTHGDEQVRYFAEQKLLPLVSDELRRLVSMIRPVPDFPRAGIEFRHVLNIAQQPRGLETCTTLLRDRFGGDWGAVEAIIGCETGGFIYGTALAMQVSKRMVLIRKGGKLPPPTVSVAKPASHISAAAEELGEKIEIGRDEMPPNASVVVIDDVLATGRTLGAVLQLLGKVGVEGDRVSVLVVAEFPAHGGRQYLRSCGFGKVSVDSLVVLGGD